MKRQDLLRSLPASPFFLNRMLAGGYVEMDSGECVIFVNIDLVRIDRFSMGKFPKEVIAILPIRIPEDQTLDDAIRIYMDNPYWQLGRRNVSPT